MRECRLRALYAGLAGRRSFGGIWILLFSGRVFPLTDGAFNILPASPATESSFSSHPAWVCDWPAKTSHDNVFRKSFLSKLEIGPNYVSSAGDSPQRHKLSVSERINSVCWWHPDDEANSF